VLGVDLFKWLQAISEASVQVFARRAITSSGLNFVGMSKKISKTTKASKSNPRKGRGAKTNIESVNQVLQENCLVTMSRMQSDYVDLVVTSPPYDNLKDYNGYSFEFDKVCAELFRVLKPGGVVVWVVGDATQKGTESGTSFRQALQFMETGFNLHDTMIWHKSNVFNFGSNACYRQSFEYMFVLSKGKPKAINLIKDVPAVLAGSKVKGARKHASGVRDEVPDFTVGDFKKRDNVWKMPTSSGTSNGHPATFPLQLAMDHIQSWSNEGDLVYDPFMGSGTTGLAAKKLNRNWLGSEISREYSKLARKRIAGS
jgi:site-specific DNA-methyltransferase (adenine-specific)